MEDNENQEEIENNEESTDQETSQLPQAEES